MKKPVGGRQDQETGGLFSSIKQKYSALYKYLPSFISALVILLLWQYLGMSGRYHFLPSLSEIAVAGFSLIERGLLKEAILTIRYFIIGISLAVVLGVPIGALMGHFQKVEQSLDVYVNTFMAAPVSALVPVLIVLFGLNPVSIIATVFMFGFFVIIVNTFTGVRETPQNLKEMARSFGANERQIMRRVVLPHAIPMAVTGIRMALARGVNGVIFGEMMIAVVGLGGMLMFYGGAFRVPELFSMLILVVGFSIILDTILGIIERRVAPWR